MIAAPPRYCLASNNHTLRCAQMIYSDPPVRRVFLTFWKLHIFSPGSRARSYICTPDPRHALDSFNNNVGALNPPVVYSRVSCGWSSEVNRNAQLITRGTAGSQHLEVRSVCEECGAGDCVIIVVTDILAGPLLQVSETLKSTCIDIPNGFLRIQGSWTRVGTQYSIFNGYL